MNFWRYRKCLAQVPKYVKEKGGNTACSKSANSEQYKKQIFLLVKNKRKAEFVQRIRQYW